MGRVRIGGFSGQRRVREILIGDHDWLCSGRGFFSGEGSARQQQQPNPRGTFVLPKPSRVSKGFKDKARLNLDLPDSRFSPNPTLSTDIAHTPGTAVLRKACSMASWCGSCRKTATFRGGPYEKRSARMYHTLVLCSPRFRKVCDCPVLVPFVKYNHVVRIDALLRAT